MKTDNKEEAKRLMNLEMPEKTTIKIDVLRTVINMVLNEEITYGKACEILTVLALNENNQYRFHPETFERVVKPNNFDDFSTSKCLELWHPDSLKVCIRYRDSLTLDQLLERCKEMSNKLNTLINEL